MALKISLVLLLMVVSGGLGDVALKQGMDQVGPVEVRHPRDAWEAGKRFFANRFVWLGICLLAVYFFSFAVALSWADVSLVVPISALSFVLTATLASLFLGEKVLLTRWLGTFLIVLGVALVVRNR